MIVGDANVVFALVAHDSVTSTARAIHATDAEWVVPALWQSEVLNALLNGVKAGHLSLETALTAIESADVLLRGRIRTCDAATILETAHTCRFTAYDATYVVLARALGVVFVTEDKQILRACPDVARSMRQFLEPPEARPWPCGKDLRATCRTPRKTVGTRLRCPTTRQAEPDPPGIARYGLISALEGRPLCRP